MELATIKKPIRALSYWVCSVGMFLIIPLMLMTTSDVISRSFFNKPITGFSTQREASLPKIITGNKKKLIFRKNIYIINLTYFRIYRNSGNRYWS